MPKNPFDLQSRVAIVTGAGSGIGRATANLLDSLGATVVATDIDTAAGAETLSEFVGNGWFVPQDVTSEDDWGRVVEEVSQKTGRLDILVNNAGIMVNSPFLETSLSTYRRQHQVNVESVFMGMHAAIPLMKATVAKGDGTTCSIVNVSSIFGQIVGETFAAYSTTKGAVRLLSKAVANEVAPLGIRVNSIHPGPTDTNLTSSWDPLKHPDGSLVTQEQMAAMWGMLIPMGRVGEPQDIASTIAFLATDAARYITGAELVVDGGYSIR